MKKKYASLIRKGILLARAHDDLALVVGGGSPRVVREAALNVIRLSMPDHPLALRAYYDTVEKSFSSAYLRKPTAKPSTKPYIGKPVPPATLSRKDDKPVSKPRIVEGFHE